LGVADKKATIAVAYTNSFTRSLQWLPDYRVKQNKTDDIGKFIVALIPKIKNKECSQCGNLAKNWRRFFYLWLS